MGTGRHDYSLPDGTDRLSDKRKEPFFTVLCKGDRSTTYIWHIEMGSHAGSTSSSGVVGQTMSMQALSS
jgi:hypothetical protein